MYNINWEAFPGFVLFQRVPIFELEYTHSGLANFGSYKFSLGTIFISFTINYDKSILWEDLGNQNQTPNKTEQNQTKLSIELN